VIAARTFGKIEATSSLRVVGMKKAADSIIGGLPG
jgi:hypothetical protein